MLVTIRGVVPPNRPLPRLIIRETPVPRISVVNKSARITGIIGSYMANNIDYDGIYGNSNSTETRVMLVETLGVCQDKHAIYCIEQ